MNGRKILRAVRRKRSSTEDTEEGVKPVPPVIQQTLPVIPKTPPFIPKTPPVIPHTPRVIQETPPVIPQTPPVILQKLPVIQQTPPVVQQTPPVIQQTPPVTLQTQPVIPQTPSVIPQTPQIREGVNHEDLINKLKEKRFIQGERVASTMLAVDRRFFCPTNPYMDYPQLIDHSAYIEAPQMHAIALGILGSHLQPGYSALDVGCGTGYLTACMMLMVAHGKVAAVDHNAKLVRLASNNIMKIRANARWNVSPPRIVVGDGRGGCPQWGPYNAIHVGAAVPNLSVIQKLIEQLKPGGRLLVPVGPSWGEHHLTQVDKKLDGSIEVKVATTVKLVPVMVNRNQLKDYNGDDDEDSDDSDDSDLNDFKLGGDDNDDHDTDDTSDSDSDGDSDSDLEVTNKASTSSKSSNSNVSGNMLDWYIKQARDAMDKGNMTEALHWKQKAQEYKEKELDKHKETIKEDTVSELHNSIVNLNISDSSYRLSNVTGSLEEAKDIINKAKEKIANGDLKKAEDLLLKAENVSSETEVRDLVRQVRVGLEGGVVSTVRVESVPTESDARSDRSEPTPDQIQIVRRVMEAIDDYQVLGVTSSSTKKEVTKARRNLWARLHADNNKAPGANDAYNRVSEAAKRILERVQ